MPCLRKLIFSLSLWFFVFCFLFYVVFFLLQTFVTANRLDETTVDDVQRSRTPRRDRKRSFTIEAISRAPKYTVRPSGHIPFGRAVFTAPRKISFGCANFRVRRASLPFDSTQSFWKIVPEANEWFTGIRKSIFEICELKSSPIRTFFAKRKG